MQGFFFFFSCAVAPRPFSLELGWCFSHKRCLKTSPNFDWVSTEEPPEAQEEVKGSCIGILWGDLPGSQVANLKTHLRKRSTTSADRSQFLDPFTLYRSYSSYLAL